jgi:hypothetical protein
MLVILSVRHMPLCGLKARYMRTLVDETNLVFFLIWGFEGEAYALFL